MSLSCSLATNAVVIDTVTILGPVLALYLFHAPGQVITTSTVIAADNAGN